MSVDFSARALAMRSRAATGRLSLTSRLRAAAASAPNRSLYSNPPLKAPPAYANSTYVARGQMVAANGNWYVAVIAGTTSASGDGPTTVLGAGVADGGVTFVHAGPAPIDADDAAAPTVAVTGTDPLVGDPTNYGLIFNPEDNFPVKYNGFASALSRSCFSRALRRKVPRRVSDRSLCALSGSGKIHGSTPPAFPVASCGFCRS